MMNGLEFLAHLMGKRESDETKVQEALAEITAQFPQGKVTISADRCDVKVECKRQNGQVLCMKCGNPMVSRVNQYFKNGQWVNKARKDNMSNWECPTCNPGHGSQPLMGMWGCGKEVTEDLERWGKEQQ